MAEGITASLGEVSNVECVKGGPRKDYCLRYIRHSTIFSELNETSL